MGASISVICFQLERGFTIEWEWIQLWLVDGDMKPECGLHVEGDMKLDGCLHMTMEKLLIFYSATNNRWTRRMGVLFLGQSGCVYTLVIVVNYYFSTLGPAN